LILDPVTSRAELEHSSKHPRSKRIIGVECSTVDECARLPLVRARMEDAYARKDGFQMVGLMLLSEIQQSLVHVEVGEICSRTGRSTCPLPIQVSASFLDYKFFGSRALGRHFQLTPFS
jgi:hypothetical protein